MFSTLQLVDISPRRTVQNILRNILAKTSGHGGESLDGDMSHTDHAQITVYAHSPLLCLTELIEIVTSVSMPAP